MISYKSLSMDFHKLLRLGLIKTIWINFKVLPFRQAIHFPIVLARSVRIGVCKRGSISLKDGGLFHIGFHGDAATYPKHSLLHIEGKLILEGKGFHSFAPGLIMRIAKGGVLRIGNNFSCHRDNTFIVNKSVSIGNDNMWSFEVLTMDTDAHVICSEDGELLNPNKEVVIGDNVWIGCRNTILKGAFIPDGCVMGSGGVITKRLETPRCIYCGNKLIKENIVWHRRRNIEKEYLSK